MKGVFVVRQRFILSDGSAVLVEVDLAGLASKMGRRAVRAKRGKAMVAGGLVQVRLIPNAAPVPGDAVIGERS